MNRKNLVLIIIGVFVAIVIIVALMFNTSSGPSLHQKTDLMFNVTNS